MTKRVFGSKRQAARGATDRQVRYRTTTTIDTLAVTGSYMGCYTGAAGDCLYRHRITTRIQKQWEQSGRVPMCTGDARTEEREEEGSLVSVTKQAHSHLALPIVCASLAPPADSAALQAAPILSRVSAPSRRPQAPEEASMSFSTARLSGILRKEVHTSATQGTTSDLV